MENKEQKNQHIIIETQTHSGRIIPTKVKHGIWEARHYKNGKPGMTVNFNKGMLHGPIKYFFKDGSVEEEGVFEMDVRIGIWTKYIKHTITPKSQILYIN